MYQIDIYNIAKLYVYSSYSFKDIMRSIFYIILLVKNTYLFFTQNI
jgi:hypothetical protein